MIVQRSHPKIGYANMNDTRQFYNGKKILITGGTGFLGLAIIGKEKKCIYG